jgi:hypothetical protein
VSEDSVRVAGILLITVPTIAFGGAMLLKAIARREPGYLDNPVTSPRAEKPSGLIHLVPIGGTVLAVAALMLGIGLVTA